MTKDNLTTNASNEAESPAFLVGAVMPSYSIDSEGKVGKVIACKDLHNVHVIFEGDGLEVKVHGKTITCSGSGLYCFVDGCEENSEDVDPLYYFGYRGLN